MPREDDKTQDKDEAKTAGIPEVDAEIVEEAAPLRDAPFDDAEPTQSAAAGGSLISPGVLLFVAMLILGVAACVYWYVTRDVYPNSEAAAPAPQQTETAIARETESAAKLTNDEDVKEALQAAAQPTEGDTQFPPLSSRSISNADLASAAKEAATDSEGAVDLEQGAGAPPPLAFEFEETLPIEDNTDIAEDLTQRAADTNSFGDNVQQADNLGKGNALAATENAAEDANEGVDGLDSDEVAALADQASGPAFEAEGGPLLSASDPLDAETHQRLETLETAMQALQNELDVATGELVQTQGRFDAAQEEISALRAENRALKEAARQSPAVAGAIALNAIGAAVENGAPFAAELAVVEETAPASGAIAILRLHADSGATPMATIRHEFAAAARAGLGSANRETADGLVERYSARVAGLFNIRPASPQPGANPGAVISRAEYAVEQGDLAGAIAEIETLPQPAQDAMGAWITLARERAQIDEALHALAAAFAEQAAPPESL